MLKSSLCDYSDVYKLVSGNITTTGDPELPAAAALKHKYKQQNQTMKEIKEWYLKIVLHLLIE